MAGNERVEGEEVGLSSWPMSRSYPASSTHVQMEARKILRTMMARKKETEVVLKNSNPEENDSSEHERCGEDRLGPLCCISSADSETVSETDVDDVDGLAEDIMRPLVKLLFLKILLVDIGISVGDFVTDFLQGLNLVFDAEWNVQWSTYHYGLGILAVMWIPGLVVLLHQTSGEAAHRLLPESTNLVSKLGVNILLFTFFPLVPTILYLRVLLTKRAFTTGRKRLVFLKLEATSHEIKAIAGALESPMELIILLWLLLRGILQLPWDHSLASSCVEDSLGRVACLPSLPVASAVFSLLSILKTLCDLNITPLVSRTDQAHSVLKMSYSCQLLAQFCPFFVSNIFFRCFSFAFIITYLDNWAVIPGSLVFMLIVAHTALFSSSQAEESGGELVKIGEGDEADPRSIVRDTRSSCSQEEEHFTTPVLLNSVLGFFLPIAYSPPNPESTSPEKGKLESQVRVHSKRQAITLRSQALLVNTCTLVVVVAIYCLVTYTTTFNYRSNILTPWWFTVAFLYLVLLFICSFLLSWLPEPVCLQENAQEDPASPATRPRSRHPTEESSRLSVHSTSSHLVKEEQGPANLGLRVAFSLLLTLLVLTPTIVGLVLFKTMPDDDIRLLQVKEGEDGLVHRHFTHLTSLNPEWNREDLNECPLATGCGDKEDIKDSVLLVNMSLPACRSLHRRLAPGVFGSHPPKAVIILEDSPETIWRLSSPPSYVHLGRHLPVFRARTVDWSQGWTASEVAVVRGVEQDDLVKGLKCSDDREVYVGEQPSEGCVRRKWLHEDGRITESRCVRTGCKKNGLPCYQSTVKAFNIECRSHLKSPVFMKYPENSRHQLLGFQFKNGKQKEICCQDSSEYFRFYGSECMSFKNFVNASKYCIFSEIFSLIPCSYLNQQENSKFCKFSGFDCILQKSFVSVCSDKEVQAACDIKKLSCADVVTMIDKNN